MAMWAMRSQIHRGSAMTCPNCQSSDWVVVDSNGADYPETRVEQCKCNNCENEFTNVLTA